MKKYDVYGVGNALVDTIVSIDPKFLKDHKIRKGVMTLVDVPEQHKLLEDLKSMKITRRSGGSAANTLIGIANSGGTGCYFGKVADDDNGHFYKQDMEKSGIAFEDKFAKSGETGTCVVLTTPDADRTMLTCLGVSNTLSKSDLDLDMLKESQIAYVEGYLWDGQTTKDASILTMESAKKNKVKVAFTYSDPFCVNRSKEDFLKLTKEYVDYAFCNHEEAMALTDTDNPEDALVQIGTICPVVFMTWGKEGAYVCIDGIAKQIFGFKVKAIDTNGAGDAFASGVLYGLTHGYSYQKACRWGNYVASRIVMEVGARLPYSLKGKQEEILKDMD